MCSGYFEYAINFFAARKMLMHELLYVLKIFKLSHDGVISQRLL